MPERPFHHGNLRAVLLDETAAMLRESGVDGISLREIARRAGVSHGAPRSHFPDRQALLDAVAAAGFARLTADVQRALSGGGDLRAQSRRVARAYVDFAIDDAALMELMFQAKTNGRPGVEEAAMRLFGVLDAALGPADGRVPDGGPREVFKLLYAAMMQGVATLVSSRRIPRAQGDVLVDEAVDVLFGSALRQRVIGPTD